MDAVAGYLRAQDRASGVSVVAIDLSASYLAAVRQALPGATVVADHFHLVRLGNQMITQARQRVTRELTGGRGRATGRCGPTAAGCCEATSGSPRRRSP